MEYMAIALIAIFIAGIIVPVVGMAIKSDGKESRPSNFQEEWEEFLSISANSSGADPRR